MSVHFDPRSVYQAAYEEPAPISLQVFFKEGESAEPRLVGMLKGYDQEDVRARRTLALRFIPGDIGMITPETVMSFHEKMLAIDLVTRTADLDRFEIENGRHAVERFCVAQRIPPDAEQLQIVHREAIQFIWKVALIKDFSTLEELFNLDIFEPA